MSRSPLADGCADFPILTITRRNLTAALPALEEFLDVPAGSLTGFISTQVGGGEGGAGGRARQTLLAKS
jgi:hypothetical protein